MSLALAWGWLKPQWKLEVVQLKRSTTRTPAGMKERSTVCTTLAQRHQRSSSWCLRPACTTRNHPRTGSKGTPRKNEHEPTFSQWGFSRASQNGACHEEKKGLQREAFSSLLLISAGDYRILFYLSWKVFFLEMFHSLKREACSIDFFSRSLCGPYPFRIPWKMKEKWSYEVETLIHLFIFLRRGGVRSCADSTM